MGGKLRTSAASLSTFGPDKLERYGTIAAAAAVNRLRAKAWGRLSLRDMVNEPGTPLEKLYRNYAILELLASEVINSIWTSVDTRVEVTDKLTGGKPQVMVRFSMKLKPSILPTAAELVKLAF